MILHEGSYGTYVIDRDRVTGEVFCTCPAYYFRGKCKHVEVVDVVQDVFKVERDIHLYKSHLGALNEIFGGYLYSSDIMVTLYGTPNVGKTLFSVEEMFNIARQGYNVLYIDTEGSGRQMIQKWREIFRSKYGVGEGKMYYEARKTFESLFMLFGVKARVVFQAADKKEEKGKMEFRVIKTFDKTEFDDIVSKYDIKFVILDSVISPIRQRIPDERQNNPAKASAISMLLGRLSYFQEKYNFGVLMTSHAVLDPTNPYQTGAILRGGIAIKHYSKRILYMDRREKKGLANYRRIWVVRGEDIPELGIVVGAKIDDSGYSEADINLKELLTGGEYDKVMANA